MSEYLFLGGPANGQTREVENDEAVTRYISLPDAPDFSTLAGRSAPHVGAGAAVIHTYARRELRVTNNGTGREHFRVLYVHEGIPSPQHMTNELMLWLLASWVLDGQEISTGEVVSVDAESADS